LDAAEAGRWGHGAQGANAGAVMVHGQLGSDEVPFWHLIGYRTNPNDPQEGTRSADRLGECTICMEEMRKDQVLATLPCYHHFHHACVAAWFTQKIRCHQDGCCPNCNLIVVKPANPRPRRSRSRRGNVVPPEELVPFLPLPYFRDMMIEPARRRFLLKVFAAVTGALILNCIFVWVMR